MIYVHFLSEYACESPTLQAISLYFAAFEELEILRGNERLSSLAGLEGLTSVHRLFVMEADVLLNMQVLENLNEASEIGISENENLHSLWLRVDGRT